MIYRRSALTLKFKYGKIKIKVSAIVTKTKFDMECAFCVFVKYNAKYHIEFSRNNEKQRFFTGFVLLKSHNTSCQVCETFQTFATFILVDENVTNEEMTSYIIIGPL